MQCFAFVVRHCSLPSFDSGCRGASARAARASVTHTSTRGRSVRPESSFPCVGLRLLLARDFSLAYWILWLTRSAGQDGIRTASVRRFPCLTRPCLDREMAAHVCQLPCSSLSSATLCKTRFQSRFQGGLPSLRLTDRASFLSLP